MAAHATGHPGLLDARFLDEDRLVLVRGSRGAVVLYEHRTARRLRTLRAPSPDVAPLITASETGGRMALCVPGGDIELHDLRGEVPVWTLERAGEDGIAFELAPDGNALWVGGDDGRVHMLDLAQRGKAGRRVKVVEGPIVALRMGGAGRRVFCAGGDGEVAVIDAVTSRVLTRIEDGIQGEIVDMDLSRDATRLLTLCSDGSAVHWDVAQEPVALGRIAGNGKAPVACDLSEDGEAIALIQPTGELHLWLAGTEGPEVVRPPASQPRVCVRMSHGARSILSLFWSTPGLLDLVDETVTLFDQPQGDARTSSYSAPDGILLYSGSAQTVSVFDTRAGRVRSTIQMDGGVRATAWLRESMRVVVTTQRGELRIYDGILGDLLHQVIPAGGGARSLAATYDGRHFLCGLEDGRLLHVNGQGDPHVEVLAVTKGAIGVLAAASAGPRAVFAGDGGAARAVDFADPSSPRTWDLSPHGPAAIHPAGNQVLCLRSEDLALLRRVENEGGARTFEGGKPEGPPPAGVTTAITHMAFSEEGDRVVLVSMNGSVRTWDTKRRKLLAEWVLPPGAGHRVHFARGGKTCMVMMPRAPLLLFDAETGEARGGMLSTRRGWSVVDGDLAYDHGGDPGSAWFWHHGASTSDLVSRPDLREPGLLDRLLSGRAPPVVTGAPPQASAPPAFELRVPAPGSARVVVDARNQGGGIGRLEIFLNGKPSAEDARGGTVAVDSKAAQFDVDLSESPYLLPGERNRVEARMSSGNGLARARGPVLHFEAPGEPQPPPRLFAVVCGVSAYADGELDLQFAADDARSFARALELTAAGLFPPDSIHITLLTSPAVEGAVRADRSNLVASLEAIRARARSGDVLVVYLSGHGVAIKDDYHYLLADARKTHLEDGPPPADVRLSGEELIEHISRIPAVRGQLLVLDTCAAGEVRDAFREAAARRWLTEGASRETGAFVMAGCAADRQSYESSVFGQGLLTHALLHGLQCGCAFRGTPIDEPVEVDVRRLLDYAHRAVPALARDLGLKDLQQPVMIEPDASFLLGRLTPEAVRQLTVRQARPTFLRSRFFRHGSMRDPLRLSGLVDKALHADPDFAWPDSDRMPGAFRLTGFYRQQGEEIELEVVLDRTGPDGEEAEHAAWKLVLAGSDVAAVVQEVMARSREETAD